MKPVRCMSTAILLACLGACATPTPIRFYTLAPPATAAVGQAAPAAAFVINVLPVTVPAQSDQQQLVVRQDENRVLILDHERWASPLPDEVRGAVSVELAQRLGTRDIAGLPDAAGSPVLRVKLQIRRLEVWPGRVVRLSADWDLSYGPEGAKAQHLTHGGQFEVPTQDSYPAMVASLQKALSDLSQALATDALKVAESTPAGAKL